MTVPASHRFTTDQGHALAVHDWGGDGPPVLLAHPTGFHGLVWAPVARRLTAVGRRVWSFDFRGHGDSDAPPAGPAGCAWSGFAHDAVAVARHLGLAGDPRAVACGHSKGGAALLLGEAAHPGTFARLWCYEPVFFATDADLPPDHDFLLARAARRRRDGWASTEEAFGAFAAKPPLSAMTAEALRAYVDHGLRDRGDGVLELKCRPEVEAAVYAMAPANGVYRAAPAVAPPVLVVCGGDSTDIPPRLGSKLVARLPRGRLEVLAGAGHFGPQQDPVSVAASILAFAPTPAPPPGRG